MLPVTDTVPIDDNAIASALERHRHSDAGAVRDVLAKARELHGLDAADVAVLMNVSDPELLGELFHAAQHVKDTIYGRRLVLFAPLYVSNLCANECTYCAFRARNTERRRGARCRRRRSRRRCGSSSTRATSACCWWPASRTRARASRTSSKCDRHDLRRHARHRRDAPRQRERGAADARRVPRAEGPPDRHLPALPGNLPPRAPTLGAPAAGRSATTTGA